jgi:ABC-type bacteriocin/lantibiotic exporter with double-glycine peptidase domain
MILASLMASVVQSNGISYTTANIISSIQKNDRGMTYQYLYYLVGLVVIYLIIVGVFKYYKSHLLTKLRQWIRHQLIAITLKVNNEHFSTMNFTKLYSPINRISSVCFMVFSDIAGFILPNTMFLLVISSFFIYKNWMFGLGFFLANILMITFLAYNWKHILKKNEEYEEQIGHNESYLMEILNNIDKNNFKEKYLNLPIYLLKTQVFH